METSSSAYSRYIPAHLSEAEFVRSRERKAAQILAVISAFKVVNKNTSLLDIGCHEGTITNALAESAGAVTGVDVDADAIAAARSHFGQSADFQVSQGNQLPFADASMDVVVLNHVLYYVSDQTSLLAEIKRVLKADGLCYVSLINGHYLMKSKGRLARLCNGFVIRHILNAVDDCGKPLGYADYLSLVEHWQVIDVLKLSINSSNAFGLHNGVIARALIFLFGLLPEVVINSGVKASPGFIFLLLKGSDPLQAKENS